MRIRGLILGSLVAVGTATATVPAFAHDWDDWRRHEWREHVWRERQWREHALQERAWREHQWRERMRYGGRGDDAWSGYPGYYR